MVIGSSLAGYGAVDLVVASPDVQVVRGAGAAVEDADVSSPIRCRIAGHSRCPLLHSRGAYDTDVKGARELRTASTLLPPTSTTTEVPEGHGSRPSAVISKCTDRCQPSPP